MQIRGVHRGLRDRPVSGAIVISGPQCETDRMLVELNKYLVSGYPVMWIILRDRVDYETKGDLYRAVPHKGLLHDPRNVVGIQWFLPMESRRHRPANTGGPMAVGIDDLPRPEWEEALRFCAC